VRRLLELRTTSIALAILTIALALATLAEVTLDAGTPHVAWLVGVDYAVTGHFVVALLARVATAPRGARVRALRERWLDAIAVLPVLPPVHAVRALRLLRVAGVLRIPRLLRRYRGALFVRAGGRELVFAVTLLFLIVAVASAAIVALEHEPLPRAIWKTVHDLFASDLPAHPPRTLAARLVSVVVMFLGLGLFATLTGTVSAFVAERLRSEDNAVEWEDLSNHLIICGWNRKAELIVREYRAAGMHEDLPIIVITEFDAPPPFNDPSLRSRVQFLNDDFTKVAALERVGIRRAATCIVLSDTTRGRRERDADARTVLAALTIEKLNSKVYVCAEINRRENATHLEMGNVDDYVVSGEHSAFLLAQAAINRGVMGVFAELLTYEEVGRNKFKRLKITAGWHGKTFFELLVHLKKAHDAILIAVEDDAGAITVNPTDYRFRGGDQIVVIAPGELEL
jgi:voltage-gated potassium channel